MKKQINKMVKIIINFIITINSLKNKKNEKKKRDNNNNE